MKLRTDVFRNLSLFSLAFAVGCAASGEISDEPETPGNERAVTESAGHVLCDVINQVPSFSVGSVTIDKPTCSNTDYDNLYYLGSIGYSVIIRPGTPAPSQKPAVMADAIYCALRDSDGARADGTVPTALGRFGMESQLVISTKDPVGRRIVGQRLGKLYLFDHPITLDSQDVSATFPTEAANSLLFRTTGYYMDLTSSTTSWHIGGNGTLPTVPPLTLSIAFDETGNFQSFNNDGFSWKPHGGNNAPNQQFSWQTVFGGCNQCLASHGLFCTCPSATDTAQHNAFANWTDAQYAKLTDGILPYYGTYGTSGNYVYRETSRNWFQFGKPNGALTSDGDPSHSGNSFSPTANLTFNFGLNYDIIDLELELDVGFRSGMEMTQNQYFINEFANHLADVQTHLDAESRASLDAHLKIANPFPFGPSYLVDETFSIFHPTPKAQSVTPTSIAYDDVNGYPYYDYYVDNMGSSNPQASINACLQAPPVSNPPVQPDNPQTGLTQAVSNAKQELYPCHVVLCKPATANAVLGTVRNCEWNILRQRLDCTDTTTTCEMCRQSADLCDASGNVYYPTSITNSIGCAVQ